MPSINITEHSDTYSWQTVDRSFGCVAFPITAIWGPAYDSVDSDSNPDWQRFQAGYRGTTDFVSTFRGANNAMGARDKSYDYALKLLGAGYDILVKRADGMGCRSSWVYNVSGTLEATGDPVAASGTCSGGTQISIKKKGPGASRSVTWTTGQGNCRVEVTAKSSLGAAGNFLKARFVRTSPTHFVEIGSGATIPTDPAHSVSGILYVYRGVSENSGTPDPTTNGYSVLPTDELLEKIPISFTEPGVVFVAGETEGSLVAQTTPSATVTGISSYVEQAVFTGVGLFSSLDNNYMPPILNGVIQLTGGTGVPVDSVTFTAKYPGTYGNQLKVRIKVTDSTFGRIGTVEVFDRSGYVGNDNQIVATDKLLEIVSVAFDPDSATDDRPLLEEASFAYLEELSVTGSLDELTSRVSPIIGSLHGATDYAYQTSPSISQTPEGQIPASPPLADQIENMVNERFDSNGNSFTRYISSLVNAASTPLSQKITIWNQQKVMQNAIALLDELTDPIIYDWDCVFMGIMDDQYVPKNYFKQHPDEIPEYDVSTAHIKMLDVASKSKCGAAFIGTPFGMGRGTYDPVSKQATGAVKFKNDLSAAAGESLSTYGEVVGPWVHASLPLAGDQAWVTPEVGHLLLIINADGVGGCQRWWLPPAGMLGKDQVFKPEYNIKKGYLDVIQNHEEGVCLNPLMSVPGKGVTCFGNSTLWDKPLGSYNALQNLSTRLLCNRVKQRVWDTALLILFKYNNEDAYAHFYAGLTPLLDEMKNLGALNATDANPFGYRVIMNPDIINLDRINANTVIGKVELAVTGVIDNVDVDIFLLPPNAFEFE